MSFPGLVTVTVPSIQLFMWSSRRITVTNFIESSAGDQAEKSVTRTLLYTAEAPLAWHAYQEVAHWLSVFLFRSLEKKLTIQEEVRRSRESSPSYLKSIFCKKSSWIGEKNTTINQIFLSCYACFCLILMLLDVILRKNFSIKTTLLSFPNCFRFTVWPGFVPFPFLLRFL